MKFEVTVCTKNFTDKDGNLIQYYEFSGDLLGVKIKLKPDVSSSRLARYVLDNYFNKK